jgi:hypothetical protein
MRQKLTHRKTASLTASSNCQKIRQSNWNRTTPLPQGFYRSQPEVNDAITKAAKAKDAYAFYIVRQVDANQGGNQRITAFIYKQDAKKRVLQSPDAIPPTLKLARCHRERR